MTDGCYSGIILVDMAVTPFPEPEESRSEFTARYVSSTRAIKQHPDLAKRYKMADIWWNQAKRGSMVSITTGDGEWLVF